MERGQFVFLSLQFFFTNFIRKKRKSTINTYTVNSNVHIKSLNEVVLNIFLIINWMFCFHIEILRKIDSLYRMPEIFVNDEKKGCANLRTVMKALQTVA